MNIGIREEKVNEEIEKRPERLVTLDILRGIAIFGVTCVHIGYKLFDSQFLFDRISSGEGFPIIVWMLIGVLGYFGTWHGFFLFISAIVNSYTFTKKAFKQSKPSLILVKNIIGGSIIFVMGYLIEGLGYFGYFGHALRTGEWNTFSAFTGENFWIQTLQIIGLCIIINGFIQFLLFRNNGHEKVKRNLLIYGGLAILILIVTPLINFGIANLGFWEAIPGRNWPDIYFVSPNRSVGVWFLTIIAGPKDPLFPYLTSAFVGGMIGIYLGTPKPDRRTLTWFSLGGVGLILIGGMLIVISYTTSFRIDPRIPFIDTGLPFSIIEEPPSMSYYVIRLGGQICLVMAMLRVIEFRGKGEVYANFFILRYFRRWSGLSLTLYSLQILELLPRWLLKISFYDTGVTSMNFMEHYSVGSVWYIILIAAFILLFYELVVFIFYKVKMIGSLEWMLMKLQNVASKEKSAKFTNALLSNNVHWVSYEVEPVPSAKALMYI